MSNWTRTPKRPVTNPESPTLKAHDGRMQRTQAEWSLFLATHNLLMLWRVDRDADVRMATDVMGS